MCRQLDSQSQHLPISKVSSSSSQQATTRALALAFATPSVPQSHTSYRGAQGRNWRCALLLRLPGSFVPPRPWHWTIPVHPTVSSAACKSCNPQACNLRRAPSQHLQSLPVKAPPAPSLGCLLLPPSPPAPSRPRPSQITRVSSPVLGLCHANLLPNLSGQSYTKPPRTHHSIRRQLINSFFFPNSSSTESKPPAQLNHHGIGRAATPTCRELPVC